MHQSGTTVIVRKYNRHAYVAWLLNYDKAGRPIPGHEFQGAFVYADRGSQALIIATRLFNRNAIHEMRYPFKNEECRTHRLPKHYALSTWKEFYE